MTYDEAGGQAGWAAMTPERLAEIEAKLDPAARKLADGDSLCCGWAEAYDQDIPAMVVEIKRLRAIVDKLPKTADGVPFCEGDSMWTLSTSLPRVVFGGTIIRRCGCEAAETISGKVVHHSLLYSTREAAEAAKEVSRG